MKDNAFNGEINHHTHDIETVWDAQEELFRIPGKPFSRHRFAGQYTEGTAMQYQFSATHDIEHMVQLFGGNAKFCQALDKSMQSKHHAFGSDMHELQELNRQMDMGFGQLEINNQPTFHVLYLYVAAGCPRNGLKYIRRVMTELFKDGKFPGDEDTGSMASWYLLSALGLFPLRPGRPEFTLGLPLFAHVEINSELTILAKDNGIRNEYTFNSIKLNDKELSERVDYRTLMQGGLLEFEFQD